MILEEESSALITTSLGALTSAKELSVTPPPLLYHFTDAAGLIGIIETGRIWASRAACLNDATEMTHGISVGRRVLEKRLGLNPATHLAVVEALEDLAEPFPEAETAMKFDSFIVSFCGRVDKSVHWLHYGREGHGYAIGIEASQAQPDDWQSVPVIYDSNTQESILNFIYDAIDSKFLEVISGRSSSESKILRSVAAHLLASTSRILAPCFKNSAFSEEEEWRVFRFHIESSRISKQHMLTPEFRTSNGRIVPYVHLELKTGTNSPIREIVAGYQIDEAVTKASLRFLFRKAGIAEPLFRKSDVPVQS